MSQEANRICGIDKTPLQESWWRIKLSRVKEYLYAYGSLYYVLNVIDCIDHDAEIDIDIKVLKCERIT